MNDNSPDKRDSIKSKDNQPVTLEEQGEEIAHLDDAVIGRAFRWSIIALVLILAAGGAAFWFFKRKPAALAPKVTPISAPTIAQRAAAEIPFVKLTDVTAEAGITFVHNNGAYGDKLLPETMGSGVAFFDFVNDGD